MIFNTYGIGTKFFFFSEFTFTDMTTKNQRNEATCAQVTQLVSGFRVHFEHQSSLLEYFHALFENWELVAVLLKLSVINPCVL